MSALTDKIAAEHQRIFHGYGFGPHCTCGWVHRDFNGSQKHVMHIAEVTEAAVREQVARDIRAQRERYSCTGLEDAAYDDAARIARGGVA